MILEWDGNHKQTNKQTKTPIFFLFPAGLAFIGSMCRGGGDSVSVVEDHGGFQNIATATHEIGHR